MNKFIPEIPNEFRFEKVDTKSLVVPFDMTRPETTEEMIQRILNVKQRIVEFDDDDDDFDDFSFVDDDNPLPDDWNDDDSEALQMRKETLKIAENEKETPDTGEASVSVANGSEKAELAPSPADGEA